MDLLADAHRAPQSADVDRAAILRGLKRGDVAFRLATQLAAIGVLVLLSAIAFSLIDGGYQAFRTFGFGFLTTRDLEPRH